MQLSDFLKSVEIFSDLNEDHLNLLVNSLHILAFPDAKPIVKRGDIGRFLWVVYDGKVEVTLPKENEKRKVVAHLSRGEIFGEMSIMTGEPAMADVTSAGISNLVKIPREMISHVIAKNPKTLTKMSRLITKRL
ncbi:MAG: cyclic nucleotide-binding domain-containing protein, partial [Syntrophales bacterium LBB04]|nr:cyclic nucleotide-binding domain-containing protein [Syntrophales bacterium LBB04]